MLPAVPANGCCFWVNSREIGLRRNGPICNVFHFEELLPRHDDFANNMLHTGAFLTQAVVMIRTAICLRPAHVQFLV